MGGSLIVEIPFDDFLRQCKRQLTFDVRLAVIESKLFYIPFSVVLDIQEINNKAIISNQIKICKILS